MRVAPRERRSAGGASLLALLRNTGMSHYSDRPGHVRVDFFKPGSGKWYMTEMLDMSDEYEAPTVFAAVRNALSRTRHGRLAEKRWVIVVLAPYHQNAYPVMLTPGHADYSDYPPDSLQAQTLLGEVHPDGLWSGVDWSSIYKIRVVDPDGWRAESVEFTSLISQEDFFRLVTSSTIEDRSGGQFAEEVRAWAERKR